VPDTSRKIGNCEVPVKRFINLTRSSRSDGLVMRKAEKRTSTVSVSFPPLAREWILIIIYN
jgi:hypothetical protein